MVLGFRFQVCGFGAYLQKGLSFGCVMDPYENPLVQGNKQNKLVHINQL